MLKCKRARTSLTLLAIFLMASSVSLIFETTYKPKVKANGQLHSNFPYLYIYPEIVEVEPNEEFEVAVVIFNLTDAYYTPPENPTLKYPLGNLYGFDIQLGWDPDVIEYVNHTTTVPVEDYSSAASKSISRNTT